MAKKRSKFTDWKVRSVIRRLAEVEGEIDKKPFSSALRNEAENLRRQFRQLTGFDPEEVYRNKPDRRGTRVDRRGLKGWIRAWLAEKAEILDD